MIAPRRYLPSISALLCFEAVGRLGSATQAAAELSLTQSAVSRQIKTLEEQLDIKLLERQGRGFQLTDAGRNYIREVREALHRLAQASLRASTEDRSGTLNLSILPAFGMHWLAPRLQDYARQHPEVTVNLSTRLKPFDFRMSNFDAAIHFGREDWPGVNFLRLMPETVVPLCTPERAPEILRSPRNILDHTLLHLETRPKGWQRWLKAVGVEEDVPPGMMFDQFSTMAQAAIHGLGIALLPTFAAEPYLKSGQLVPASGNAAESIGSYYLVWPAEREESAPLRSFRDWLAVQPGVG